MLNHRFEHKLFRFKFGSFPASIEWRQQFSLETFDESLHLHVTLSILRRNAAGCFLCGSTVYDFKIRKRKN